MKNDKKKEILKPTASFFMEKDFDRWNGKKKQIDSVEQIVDCHERELWWCSIGVNVGSEQHSQTGDFSRPVLIVRRFTRNTFWGIPLTTKTMNLPFRVRFMLGDIENDALVLQMRAFDQRRLVRKIGVLSREVFETIVNAICEALTKTNPAYAGFSEAEANVSRKYTT